MLFLLSIVSAFVASYAADCDCSSCAAIRTRLLTTFAPAYEGFVESAKHLQNTFVSSYEDVDDEDSTWDVVVPSCNRQSSESAKRIALRQLHGIMRAYEREVDNFVLSRLDEPQCFGDAVELPLPLMEVSSTFAPLWFQALTRGSFRESLEHNLTTDASLRILTVVIERMDDGYMFLLKEIRKPLEACSCAVPWSQEDDPSTWYAAYRATGSGLPGFQYGMDATLALFLVNEVFPPGSTVADVGAGAGVYATWFNESGRVTAFAFDGAEGVARMTKGVVRVLRLDEAIPLDFENKFDWILCLDVAEHIPKALAETFTANLRRLARRGLVLSWTEEAIASHPNPLPWGAARTLVERAGFRLDEQLTARVHERHGASYGLYRNALGVFLVDD
eukprot:TRINITY_DN64106_c0_g1_i1.p1 TRINITY_DN64106_c0_g1~~TRINITY_DN64106_c0_g1_i1.p1  ORF type:complete len:390 (-),score=46.04 TRINITY_DN64106_c0_g1_i1:719-1888(-)